MTDARVSCASFLSTKPQTGEALQDACAAIRETLGDTRPTLAALFVSPHHASAFSQLPALVGEGLAPHHLIGCTGEGIIGSARELEEEPALSLWAAHLPGVTLHPFHVEFERSGDEVQMHGWPEPIDTRGLTPTVLLIPEPFSSHPQLLLDQFATHYPEAPVVGGIASGGMRPGKNRLFLDDKDHETGAVGLLIWGPVSVTTLVSQGCRPVGRHLVITKAQHNVVQELGGLPAFVQFQKIYEDLEEDEQDLARRALHIGCVINEHQPAFDRGDFLVRNIMGIDPQNGAIMVNDHVRVGQTVQFHVRDAGTASEDLQLLLNAHVARPEQPAASGGLIFSCNGRGTRLFDAPNHDAEMVAGALGNVPLAGLFAQGEIGPVGNRNFLHGFTASLALFGDPPPASD